MSNMEFNNLDNVFRKDLIDYKNNIDPFKHYVELTSNYISTITNKSIDSSKEALKDYIKANKRFKNPIVTFYERDKEGNKEIKTDTLKAYIDYPKQSGNIMVPSFTVYFNPKTLKSLHAEFIDANIKKRSKHKKLAFKFKIEKDFQQAAYHDTLQKSMKIFNNSLSGAYASAGTVLNNPSAHYTLTSITRCISGIGNSLSESMIAGNRHYRNPNVMFNHIVTIANSLDNDKVEKAMEKYNLYYPTAEEVMESLLKSSRIYWKDLSKEATIYEYLKKITPLQRAKVLYHIDLYHVRKYNKEFMTNLVKDFITFERIEMTIESAKEIYSKAQPWLVNLAKHIFFSNVKGLKDSDIPDTVMIDIASYLINSKKTLIEYQDFIQAFLITNIFPVSIAYLKDMVRQAIVLSDTDSTCASYANWVTWYKGEHRFDNEAMAVSASIMTLVTQTMDHYIKTFAMNMNITYEAAQVLEMKNEFTWDVFINTNVSKHYFANVRVQEGNVYDFKDPLKYLEKKGVHLIASQAYTEVRKLSETMMTDIIWTINNNKKLSLRKYIDMVIEAEKLIIGKIKSGSPEILKLEKIKEAKAYKADEYSSPYLQYLVWQEVFADKYGNAPEPTYMAIKVPTIINSKNDMLNYVNQLPEDFKNRFKSFLNKTKKDTIKTYKLPLIITYSKGLPKELESILDVKRIIMDNCKVLYIVLESIGFYVKEKETLHDMLGLQYDINTNF